MTKQLNFSIHNLKKLKHRDGFANIDLAFGDFIVELTDKDYSAKEKYLFAAAAITSYSVRNRHICVDLIKFAGQKFPEYSSGLQLRPNFEAEYLDLPKFEEWWNALEIFSDVISNSSETPLRYDNKKRIFLQKYWNYELELSQFIKQKSKLRNENKLYQNFMSISDRLSYSENKNWQTIATFVALRNKFSVISGGPGTGKTSIITTIIAQIFTHNIEANIALCAPTGKAAARIKESINTEIDHLNCSEEVLEKLKNLETYTIHRLLGSKYRSPFFKHNKSNKLIYDWIIIDESSMVDLPLMSKLFQAIPKDTATVLLGDKDQLASVEAGAILNDLCQSVELDSFSEKLQNDFKEETNSSLELPYLENNTSDLNDCIIELKQNYRFSSKDGIAKMKDAIRNGQIEAVENILRKEYQDLEFNILKSKQDLANKILDFIESLKIDGDTKYLNYLQAEDIKTAWDIFSSFKIISSHRKGPFGSEKINAILKTYLFNNEEYPIGLPVMISNNHPNLDLYNGDIGLIWRENSQKRVYFPDNRSGNKFRSITLARLPQHSPVFAMTIHKSQGSGFNQILMILPNQDSPLLTRELLYTGITRARKYCEIWSDSTIIKKATARQVNRHSGLKEKLK